MRTVLFWVGLPLRLVVGALFTVVNMLLGGKDKVHWKKLVTEGIDTAFD